MANNSILVSNLITNVEKQIISEVFSKHGQIVSLKVEDNNEGRFAIVTFENNAEAINAMENLQGQKIRGQPCSITWFQGYQKDETESKTIYPFDALSIPFGPLICEKIQEAINLLNLQKAQLSMKTNNPLVSERSQPVISDHRIDSIHTVPNMKKMNCSENQSEVPIFSDLKQSLGEKIFPIVQKYAGSLAGKITGIILTSDVAALEVLLENENLLRMKIEEIMILLKEKCPQKLHYKTSENDQEINAIPPHLSNYETEVTNEASNEEFIILSAFYTQIKHLGFFKHLSTDSLKQKLHSFKAIYPYVKKYVGSMTDKIMEKFMELDNAVLRYLISNEDALKQKINEFMHSVTRNELFKTLNVLGMKAKQKIIYIDDIIRYQSAELGHIQSLIAGLNNWIYTHGKCLFTLAAHKQNVLDDMNQIINDINMLSESYMASSNINISSSSDAFCQRIRNNNPSTLCVGRPLSSVQNIIPANISYMQPNNMIFPFLMNQNRNPCPITNNIIRSQYSPGTYANYTTCSLPAQNNTTKFDINYVEVEDLTDKIDLQNSTKIENNDLVEEIPVLMKNYENIIDEINENDSKIQCNDSVEITSALNQINEEIIDDVDPENAVNIFNNDLVETKSLLEETDEEIIDKDDSENTSKISNSIELTSLSDESDHEITDYTEAKRNMQCTELFVENLHPDVDDEILRGVFESCGKIVSIRIIRDLKTHISSGVAYITFEKHDEAKYAMEKINFKSIYRKQCRIKWPEKDKTFRKSDYENIFIKNLNLLIDDKKIYELFKSFGEILSCKVQTNDDGVSMGFAFVRFSNKESADKAIEEMNGKMIEDKVIYVGKFISKQQRQNHEFKNCYINNFGTFLHDKSLREMFEEFGEINSAKVEVDKDGKSKGFGFVSFINHVDAVKAVKTLNGKMIQDKCIYVGPAMTKSERQKDLNKSINEQENQHKYQNNLYIKNLEKSVNNERLMAEFSIFGTIKNAKVMRNEENNTSMGYGYVSFSNLKDAECAVSEMNGKIIEGKEIYVAFCRKKHTHYDQIKFRSNTDVMTGNLDNLLCLLKQENRLQYNPGSLEPHFPQTLNNTNLNTFQSTDMELSVSKNQINLQNKSKIETNEFMMMKQHLGELLYPKVYKHTGEMAGKIVGMFLELDNTKLIKIIEDENELLLMINEAFNVLNSHKAL